MFKKHGSYGHFPDSIHIIIWDLLKNKFLFLSFSIFSSPYLVCYLNKSLYKNNLSKHFSKKSGKQLNLLHKENVGNITLK